MKEVEAVAVVSAATSIEQIIIDAANKYGIDPNYALRIARCESSLNPNSVNYNYAEIPGHHPSGLFQHLTNYWPQRAIDYGYAGASVFDPVANANVTMAMWADVGTSQWECK